MISTTVAIIIGVVFGVVVAVLVIGYALRGITRALERR